MTTRSVVRDGVAEGFGWTTQMEKGVLEKLSPAAQMLMEREPEKPKKEEKKKEEKKPDPPAKARGSQGRATQRGPRKGHFYMNEKGNKVYVSQKPTHVKQKMDKMTAVADLHKQFAEGIEQSGSAAEFPEEHREEAREVRGKRDAFARREANHNFIKTMEHSGRSKAAGGEHLDRNDHRSAWLAHNKGERDRDVYHKTMAGAHWAAGKQAEEGEHYRGELLWGSYKEPHTILNRETVQSMSPRELRDRAHEHFEAASDHQRAHRFLSTMNAEHMDHINDVHEEHGVNVLGLAGRDHREIANNHKAHAIDHNSKAGELLDQARLKEKEAEHREKGHKTTHYNEYGLELSSGHAGDEFDPFHLTPLEGAGATILSDQEKAGMAAASFEADKDRHKEWGQSDHAAAANAHKKIAQDLNWSSDTTAKQYKDVHEHLAALHEEASQSKEKKQKRGLLSRLRDQLCKAENKGRWKLHGRMSINGVPISVENRAGSVRMGTSPEGIPWRTVMKDHYGYFPGVPGVDGDDLDVFVGPLARKLQETKGKDGHFDKVWVVHAKDQKTGRFDEDKVMFGYPTKEAAVSAFRRHYDDPDKFIGPVNEYTLDKFKEILKDLRQRKRGRRLGRGRFVKGGPVVLVKGGPYIGPRGGKWADPQHKIPWREAWAPLPGRGRTVLTSEDSPLRLDKVEGLDKVRLAFLPGKRNDGFAFKHRRDLDADLKTAKEDGVTHIVDLTEKGEPEHRGGVKDYHGRAKELGFQVIHAPIEDRTVPPLGLALDVIDQINRARSEGGTVLIHCMGGLGRTGVIAGMLMAVDNPGLGGDEIIKRIRKARGPRAPDTPQQAKRIRTFAGARVKLKKGRKKKGTLKHVPQVEGAPTDEQLDFIRWFADQVAQMHGDKGSKVVLKKATEVAMDVPDEPRLDAPKPSGGPYIGPRGGKWADPEHTIPWKEDVLETFTPDEKEILEVAQKIGEKLEEELAVHDPAFKKGVMSRIKDWALKAGGFLKYQGKTELRNNLNMFRYLGLMVTKNKEKMSPEERKASLAYMAHWTYSMVPATAGGLGMAIKAAAAAVLPSGMAWPAGVVLAYIAGTKLIYPALSKGMKKVIESKHVGEHIDDEVAQYLEGYNELAAEHDRERISLLKALEDEAKGKPLEAMAPLMGRIIHEAVAIIVDDLKHGNLPKKVVVEMAKAMKKARGSIRN